MNCEMDNSFVIICRALLIKGYCNSSQEFIFKEMKQKKEELEKSCCYDFIWRLKDKPCGECFTCKKIDEVMFND
jgi:hypothetical protein